MADIAITAASVISGSGAVFKDGTAGEAVTAGKVGYFNTSTRRWMLADADSATVQARKAIGVFLNSAGTGQPVKVQTEGPITIGGTLTAGVGYYLSGTAGGICPVADVGTGEYVCLLGLAISTTVLNLDVQFPNVAN